MFHTLAFVFLFSLRVPAAPIDTVIVHDSIGVSLPVELLDQMFYPKRGYVASKTNGALSIDSIRVGNTLVNENGKAYYLVVYDKKGVKRLEGNFYDQYPKGLVTEYDEKGKKFAEGNYKMLYSIHPVMTSGDLELHYFSEKTGTWKYFDAHGRVIKEVDYGESGRVLATRLYDAKGKLIQNK